MILIVKKYLKLFNKLNNTIHHRTEMGPVMIDIYLVNWIQIIQWVH